MAKDEKDEKDNPTDDKDKENPTEDDKNPKRIEVKIDRDKEVDSLHDELSKIKAEYDSLKEKTEEDTQKYADEKTQLQEKIDIMTAEKEQKALEMFEEEKADIIKLCTDSNLPEEQVNEIKEKLDTPQKLETVKGLVEMLVASLKKKTDDGGQTNTDDENKPKKAPAGKASIEAPPSTVDSDEEKATKIVDDIYHIVNNPQLYTPQQVKEANKKRLTLVNSMIKGKSWDQLRKNVTLGTRVTMKCPSCGNTIVGERVPERCPSCGFDFRKTGDMEQSRR